jgi:hypothetical protein
MKSTTCCIVLLLGLASVVVQSVQLHNLHKQAIDLSSNSVSSSSSGDGDDSDPGILSAPVVATPELSHELGSLSAQYQISGPGVKMATDGCGILGTGSCQVYTEKPTSSSYVSLNLFLYGF